MQSLQKPKPKFLSAIERNFAEVNNALLKLTAYNVLSRQNIVYSGMSFFVIAQQALHYDMISHAMKILDTHAGAKGLGYIKRLTVLRLSVRQKREESTFSS